LIRRIRFSLAYDGTDFHGWQIQPGLPTIQGTLEAIFANIEGKPVHVAGSGRTDAGVHAFAQVAAITIENPIPCSNLVRAVNRLLPPAIRMLDAQETHADFHPRYDAIAKSYRYTLVRAPLCLPMEWRYVHHHPYPLNEPRMVEAARLFEGEHDFSAFAASDERDAEGKSKVRTIFTSELVRADDRLVYFVRGSGFLKHMVRNMVGALVEVGRGNLNSTGLVQFLSGGGSGKVGPTAPAKGLVMESVEYPFASSDVAHANLTP
jgi:tRNA pseudouridine38-40 synthase